jgi:hypothetical protein
LDLARVWLVVFNLEQSRALARCPPVRDGPSQLDAETAV